MPRTYALSDIHGCLAKLERLVERCRRDDYPQAEGSKR